MCDILSEPDWRAGAAWSAFVLLVGLLVQVLVVVLRLTVIT